MSAEAPFAPRPLGFPWETRDPFLFCVHHVDAYPAGNERLGPRASLAGRRIGMDFEVKDGWRMYHGQHVPGFPQHPHRGFETITIARRGYIDHSDSLGAAARFGKGDVQWMTAGRGIVHSEMFPLLQPDRDNPVELFQIWLNLPARDKLVDPYFTMLWNRDIPRRVVTDPNGRRTEVTVVAGSYEGAAPPSPPPNSWAARAEANVSVMTLKLDAGAQFTLPAESEGVKRTLYFFEGDGLSLDGHDWNRHAALHLRGHDAVELRAGDAPVELLLLGGRPIGERVAHHGPFVMNTRDELEQAFLDYRRTGFGGWPWDDDEPVHPPDRGRFARHADGRVEEGPSDDASEAQPAATAAVEARSPHPSG